MTQSSVAMAQYWHFMAQSWHILAHSANQKCKLFPSKWHKMAWLGTKNFLVSMAHGRANRMLLLNH